MDDTAHTIEVLNRLYALHTRSLPRYAIYSHPWIAPGEKEAWEVVQSIAAEQDRVIKAIGSMIVENKGETALGAFPLYFTSYHDVSLDFLIDKMVEHQQRDVEAIRQCSEQLNLAPLAKAVAEDALGAAEGHLESLQELAAEGSAA